MTTLAAYRSAADTLFPVRGAWSYDTWEALNARFWDEQLTPGAILWGLTAGCDFGSFNPNNNCITLHEALPGKDFAKAAKARGGDWVMTNRDQQLSSWGLSPSAFGIGTALGTLLHETMHQAHRQRGYSYPAGRKPGTKEAHHNPLWVGECSRVAEMIGITPRLWPIYIERKEHAEEVRYRLQCAHAVDPQQPDPAGFTGKELNNRRRWTWVPTLNGDEIKPEMSDNGSEHWGGQLVAGAGEITGFPRASYEQMGVEPADRVGLVLP